VDIFYHSRIWGFHSGGYEECHLLGYDAVQSVELQPTFRRNLSPLPPSFGRSLPTSSWKFTSPVFHSTQTAPFRVITPGLSPIGSLLLGDGRANGNRAPAFHLPLFSLQYRSSGWKSILLATCLPAGSSWYYSSTLKIEAIGSSETSIATQQTTRRHIPEDDTLHILSEFISVI
jgi:hypothetical protein